MKTDITLAELQELLRPRGILAGPAQVSPTLGDALNAGFHTLRSDALAATCIPLLI